MKHLMILTLLFTSIVSASWAHDGYAEFTAASYNIRQDNHSDSLRGDGWRRRMPVMANLIQFHGFDIFGTQEGFKHQLDSLQNRLPGYAYTGVAREDGDSIGEHSAIFYRTDLFTLISHGDFWLSETPDHPGLGWDAACIRICSWGRFRHNPTGVEFMFFNLHMDHVGKTARIQGARLVRERIKALSLGIPTLVTGDFNVDQTHESYRTMTEGGALVDAFEKACIRYAPNGTFNSYRTDGYSNSRIDHLFVTPNVDVLKYGVLTDTYRTNDCDSTQQSLDLRDAPDGIAAHRYTARVPSDHFPVMTVLRVK